MHYAVILAGDLGEGLRPLASEETPTLFLALGSRRSLLQLHIDRLSSFLPKEHLVVVVRSRYERLAREQVPPDMAICTATFDTIPRRAAAAALSTLSVAGRPDSAVLIQPATHAVQDEEVYQRTIRAGLDLAGHERVAVRFTHRPSHDGGEVATGIVAYPFRTLFEPCAEEADGKRSRPDLSSGIVGEATDLSLAGAGWMDVTDWLGVRRLLEYVEKPWGYERLWALNGLYAGKVLFIKQGESLSVQYHEVKDETIRIESGRMCFRVGRSADALETVILEPGMSYAISPGVVHQMEAIEDCTVIEVSTPHLTDVVRLEDRYGRS